MITYLPNRAEACHRIKARAAAESAAEKRAAAVERARAIIRRPKGQTDAQLRTACGFYMTHGDGGTDHLLAEQHVHAIEMRRHVAVNRARLRAALPALRHDETPLQVALQHRHRWPDILIRAAFGALVILAITGWL